MENAALTTMNTETLEKVLIQGDLSKLSSQERLFYYNRVCTSLGLNPLTKPFDYITLNGKLTLYAKRDCTDQLRKLHDISIKITARGHYDKWLPCVLDNDAPDSVIYQFALDLHELIRCFEEQETGTRFCAGVALNNICPQKEEA